MCDGDDLKWYSNLKMLLCGVGEGTMAEPVSDGGFAQQTTRTIIQMQTTNSRVHHMANVNRQARRPPLEHGGCVRGGPIPTGQRLWSRSKKRASTSELVVTTRTRLNFNGSTTLINYFDCVAARRKDGQDI